MKILKMCIRAIISMRTMVILFLIYAAALAAATLVEASYGTETARALIYNARWLEMIYALLGINLASNLFRTRLWSKGKRLSGLFHLSFLVILAGAATTRYAGHGYSLHFREGEKTGRLLTDKAFLQIKIKDRDFGQDHSFPLYLSAVSSNSWRKTIHSPSGPVTCRIMAYFPEAVPAAAEDPDGGPVLALSVTDGERNMPLLLRPGDREPFNGTWFNLHAGGDFQGSGIDFQCSGDQVYIRSDQDMHLISMKERSRRTVKAGNRSLFEAGTVFSQGQIRFALQTFYPTGRIMAAPPEENARSGDLFSAVTLRVHKGNDTRDITLFGGPDITGIPEKSTFGSTEMEFAYGSMAVNLPFQLHLDKFIIDRYPGSRMPSAYESQVTIIDAERNLERPYRIYMNHILKYRHYRFYQSSYDEDEHGSILSVTLDPGTPVTYAGYALLILSLLMNLLNPRSRLRQLGKLPLLIILSICGMAPATIFAGPDIPHIDRQAAHRFGRLLVQDEKGRMKPLNTLAHESLRIFGYPNKVLNLSEDQWLLMTAVYPEIAETAPCIRLAYPEILSNLGLDAGPGFVAPELFFSDTGGQNRLQSRIAHAQGIPARSRDSADKAVLTIQEQLLLFRQLHSGDAFCCVPGPAGSEKWVPFNRAATDTAAVSAFHHFKVSIRAGQWNESNQWLNRLEYIQSERGKRLMPSSLRLETEMIYNRFALFDLISIPLIVLGMLLLVWHMILLWKPSFTSFKLSLILAGGICIGFILQNAGLILRWIAAGHAPWTNKYESMIYIAWAILLAGILFIKKHRVPLALASVLAGLILETAHLGWADPRIMNLVPVLKSHWLISHVSVITASYGFFSLSAILGLITLIIILFTGKNTSINRFTLDISRINEQSLLIGLTLIMIGNLLGAVWANESWGRYWGWDPKETWTLIVILVYTVVLHLRLVPKTNNILCVSTGSMLAFWTVLMTYLGVNFYLSGMHSYAKANAPPFPKIIIWIILVQIGLGIWAGKEKRGLGEEEKRRKK